MGDFSTAELQRRMENTLRMGTVAEVDLAAARVRVACGDILTDWLPWLARRAGSDVDWFPPSEGEQGLVLSSGDLATGVFIPGIYSDSHITAEGERQANRHRVDFSDGAVIQYDAEAHHLQISLPEDATTEIISTGGTHHVGDITVDGDVIASDVSLVHHTHGGVKRGSANTDPPNTQ